MSFLNIVYPSTVADEQKRLAAALQGTDDTVQSCPGLDDQTRASWGLFYAAAFAFTQESPGFWDCGTQMDRALSYEQELVAWQTKIQGMKCLSTTPNFNPNPPITPDITAVLQKAIWLAGIIGGAYVIGTVAQFVPKPPSR